MNNTTIASVITESGLTRCISATTAMTPGVPRLRISGVTDRAADEIKALLLAALKKRGVRLSRRTITIDLVFDVPFETINELSFTAFVSAVCATASTSGVREKS